MKLADYTIHETGDSHGLIIRCERCDEKTRQINESNDWDYIDEITDRANKSLNSDYQMISAQVEAVIAAYKEIRT